MSQRRVYLHVGTPKSGTSYLQDKLALNRDALERQGLDYVRTRKNDHFEAALDLIGEKWAGEEKAARGQWDALVTEVRRSKRHALISHEILAAASPESVERALASFPDDEVHVILTARDLGRQIPAEWQERVKHRGGRDYAAFLKALQRNYTRTDWTVWFWRVQHLPRIIATWGASLPPERFHLVTVPPPDGPRDALWHRFASVLGLSERFDYEESETTNASLGGAEVTMLRRLNGALKEQGVSRTIYVNWVRESIVKEVLAQRPDKQPATVPPGRRAAVEEITASWLEDIRASGVDVVGDLADLEPAWPDDADHWCDPDQADPELVADAAIEALAHVLARVGRAPVADDDEGAVARLTRMLRG
jgi:hypothetical protein